MPTAEAWQVSNAPVFSMAASRSARAVRTKCAWNARAKSIALTGYLRWIIEGFSEKNGGLFNIITPEPIPHRTVRSCRSRER